MVPMLSNLIESCQTQFQQHWGKTNIHKYFKSRKRKRSGLQTDKIRIKRMIFFKGKHGDKRKYPGIRDYYIFVVQYKLQTYYVHNKHIIVLCS